MARQIQGLMEGIDQEADKRWSVRDIDRYSALHYAGFSDVCFAFRK